jgi:hypothetical protein
VQPPRANPPTFGGAKGRIAYMPTTKTKTKTPVITITPVVRTAYKQYMGGVAFTTVKSRVKKPLQRAFQTLAGGITWKQLRAKRQAALKKSA